MNKKYTVAIINQLEPNKDYTFNFYAENNVGIGVSKEMKKRTPPISMCKMLFLYINLFLIVLNGSWMYHTYTLILLDKEIQASNWDPWTPLDL